MKKLLLLAALAMMAASPAEAQFFKKMKESWNNYQNEQSGNTSSYSSSSRSSSSQPKSKNVVARSVDTSPSAGQWVHYQNSIYKISAIRYPKSASPDLNRLSIQIPDIGGLNREMPDLHYQEEADNRIRTANVFYLEGEGEFMNGGSFLSTYYLFKSKEDGDWIEWDFIDNETKLSPSYSKIPTGLQVFVSNELVQELGKDLPSEDSYKSALGLWPVKRVEKKVFDNPKNVLITYENGDSIHFYDQTKVEWYGSVHLKDGSVERKKGWLENVRAQRTGYGHRKLLLITSIYPIEGGCVT